MNKSFRVTGLILVQMLSLLLFGLTFYIYFSIGFDAADASWPENLYLLNTSIGEVITLVVIVALVFTLTMIKNTLVQQSGHVIVMWELGLLKITFLLSMIQMINGSISLSALAPSGSSSSLGGFIIIFCLLLFLFNLVTLVRESMSYERNY